MPVILSFWRPESWRKSWYTASEDSVCILDCWILSALLPDLFSEENVEDSDHLLHCLVFVVQSLSRVRLFATRWTVAFQVSPSMGFSRQEYWSGLPFSSPGDLPDPGIEPGFPALEADALTSEPSGTHSKNKWLYAHGCEKGEALLPLVSCLQPQLFFWWQSAFSKTNWVSPFCLETYYPTL